MTFSIALFLPENLHRFDKTAKVRNLIDLKLLEEFNFSKAKL